MIKIIKKYERLCNIGNFENIKVGIEIEKTTELSKAEDIKKLSTILGSLAEEVVEAEVASIAKKHQKENEQ